MSGAMGGDQITVGLNLQSNVPGVAAEAGASFNTLGTTLQQLAATVQNLNSTLASLGAAVNQAGAAENEAGTATTALGAALNETGTAAQNAGAAMSEGGASGGGILGALGQVGAGFGQAANQVGGFAGGLLMAVNPLNLFHTHIMRLVEVMGLWRIFEEGSRIISELVSNIAELPVTMQRTETAWQYTFGMGQTVNPTGDTGIAQNISQQLAAWSAKYSYNLPFTRQNEMQAITNMSMMNLTPTGVEQYLPIIADLAATAGNGFGGGPVDLSRASYAIQGALMGYSRMLQYDLHIRPEQLQQYGYDANNAQATLLPALQKYAEATNRTKFDLMKQDKNGNWVDSGQSVDQSQYSADMWANMLQSGQVQDVGAARNMAKTTWYGAWSSFQDRLQNFALDIGGYPAFGADAGKLRSGSPLDMAMQGLNKFTAWWDDNQSKFNQMGDFFSKTLGKAMADAGTGLEAFAQGLSKSGLGDFLAKGMGNFSNWLSNPQTQQTIQNVSKQVGGDVGSSLIDAMKGLKDTLDGVKHFFDALGPGGRKAILDAITIPGNVLGVAGALLGGDISGAGDLVGGFWKGADNLFHGKWGDKSGAKALLGGWGQSFNDEGMGVANAWDIVMNWAGNPNGYKPGSAQKWWGGVTKNAGHVAGGVNHWLSGASDAVGTNIGKGIGTFLYQLGFGDHSYPTDNGHGMDVIRQKHDTYWDKLGGLGSSVGGGIGGFFSGMWNDLQQTGGGAGSKLHDFSTALSGLQNPLTTVKQGWDTLTTKLSDVGTLLTGSFQTAWHNLHTTLQNLHDGPLAAFHSLLQNIGTALSKIPGLSALMGGGGGSRIGGTPGSRASAGATGIGSW